MIRKCGRSVAWPALLLGAALAACTYREPAGNVISQQLTWFSYLGAEDIRAQCADGRADRFRLVYNGDHTRQARAYDVWDTREGAVVEQMVDRGIVFEAGRPIDASLIGVPVRARAVLDADELARFEALLRASGAFDPPPVGLRLNSRGHYWIVSGCRDGRFFLTGYRYPSDRYDQLQFVAFLQSRDRTGVAFPKLPAPGRAGFEQRCTRGRGSMLDNARCYWVEIGPNGLVGITTLG